MMMRPESFFCLPFHGRRRTGAARLNMLFWTTVLSGVFCFSAAEGHPVSVVQEDVYVTRDKVIVTIQIYLEDLFLFQELEPDDDNVLARKDIDKAIEKHKQFLSERIIVRDVNGERLKEKAVSVDDSSLTSEGVPMGELMLFTLDYQIEYALSDPPEFLTFSQELIDLNSVIPATVYLNLKQEGSDTPYEFAMMRRKPYTVRFNWDHPPLAQDASDREWQQWMQERREETLGITSYGTIYSFLYIEDFEVRHEVLVPLATLESFLKLDRADEDFLSVAEQDASRKKIESFFADANPIEIDGIQVKPIVSRLDYYGLDFKDFAKPAEKKPVSAVSARVGVILTYSTKGTPDKVKLTWDMYNHTVWSVDSVCFAFGRGQKSVFSQYRTTTFEWSNPGRKLSLDVSPVDVTLEPRSVWSVSIISAISLSIFCLLSLSLLHQAQRRASTYFALSILLIASLSCWPFSRILFANPLQPVPQVSAEKAETVFKTLHKNIYRAFDYHTDSDIYDALAKSAEGPFQETLFRQINQSLKMQEQGGAASRVTDVQWESIIPEAGETADPAKTHDERSFAVKSTWNVSGTVEHWGHVHTRTNQYQAIFFLEPVDGTWKLTGMNLLDQQRLNFKTNLREVELEEQQPEAKPAG